MKKDKSILITLASAAAILAVGYAGILGSGAQVLKSPEEPEQITMTGNISKLFYSRMEDDIQLYPWNYYPEEGFDARDEVSVENAEERLGNYSPYLEYNVFYTLIAVAAGVEPQDVSRWYDSQETTILSCVRQGETDGKPVGYYFYEDIIRLNGKEYEVKIACDDWRLISFSCIRVREKNIKETTEWEKHKEKFMTWMGKNPGVMAEVFSGCEEMYGQMIQMEDWYSYVNLYLGYLSGFPDIMAGSGKNAKLTEMGRQEFQVNSEEGSHDAAKEENGSEAIQMVELKDSLLLVKEGSVTLGLYYDVMDQKMTGFHFFFE